jgi:hypothetical protein
MHRSINSKKTSSTRPATLFLLRTHLELDVKKPFLRQINWQFNKKAKFVMALVVIAVVLISSFVILYKPAPTKSEVTAITQGNSTTSSVPKSGSGSHNKAPSISKVTTVASDATKASSNANKPPGLIATSPIINSTVWHDVAANAWAFFQPGIGVDPNTGLPYAGGQGFEAFTDWDLGAYIQAIIDAEKIGLETSADANARFDKILTFLADRPINETTGYPFWFYDATNGTDYHENSDNATFAADTADLGALFVGLNNLRVFDPSLAPEINNIVFNGTSNFAALLPIIQADSTSNNTYSYFVDSGFADFWSQQVGNVPGDILNNILNSPTISVSGVSLPEALIGNEPLIRSVFEFSSVPSGLTNLMAKVYAANEAYYDQTGKFIAPSEGQTPSNGWAYGWVVGPHDVPWEVTNSYPYTLDYTNPAVLYNKVAFSYLALYNTTFARSLTVFIENICPTPTNGYFDGADTSGNIVNELGTNTNSLILDAALYALQK